jgi:signal transduction histidine kinase
MLSVSKTVKTLLLAGAILAPATALALLGLRAYRAETLLLRERYRKDQAAILRLVADRASENARKALEDLEERLRGRDPDAVMEERFRAAHPIAKHIFLVRDGQLVYPALPSGEHDRGQVRGLGPDERLVSKLDVEVYVSRLRESRRVARLLALGSRAEHAGTLSSARGHYLAAARGRGALAAQALLGLARVQRRQGRAGDAAESYRTLRRRFEGQQDAAGISYALLADAGRAELEQAPLLLRVHRRLLEGEYPTSVESRRFYLRWIVDRLAARGDVQRDALARLRRSTAQQFASEQFGHLLLRHNVAELQQIASERQPGSFTLDRRTTLVLRQRGSVTDGFALDEDVLRERVTGHMREVGDLQKRGVELVMQRLGGSYSVPRERVLHASVLDPPLSEWTLAAVRPATDPMEELQRREGLRRQGLVLGLILVLLVGLLLTYRGVRRESELARLKSDFASNVSHELKTPLTSIRMYAEMLEQGIAATPADRERYQRVIIRESERLGRLIANVLDFSRIERGTRRYDLRAEDLGELTREAVETFTRLSEGERIHIALSGVNGRERRPRVRADREAALQSILNLLSNAAKYSPDVPEIEVELRGGRGEVGVEVRDRGIGIPVAEQKRIFDDFYRAPGARRAGVEGTGLGLALVRRHMSACGGRVEVRSAPGKGSSFTLWFEIAAPPAEQEESVPRREREEGAHAVDSGD